MTDHTEEYDRYLKSHKQFQEIMSGFEHSLFPEKSQERIERFRFMIRKGIEYPDNHHLHFAIAETAVEEQRGLELAFSHYQKASESYPTKRVILKIRALAREQEWDDPTKRIDIENISDPTDKTFEIKNWEDLNKAETLLEKLIEYDIRGSHFYRLMKIIYSFAPDSHTLEKSLKHLNIEKESFIDLQDILWADYKSIEDVITRLLEEKQYETLLVKFEGLQKFERMNRFTGLLFKLLFILQSQQEQSLLLKLKKINSEIINKTDVKDNHIYRALQHALKCNDSQLLNQIIQKLKHTGEYDLLLKGLASSTVRNIKILKKIYLELSPSPNSTLLEQADKEIVQKSNNTYISLVLENNRGDVEKAAHILLRENKQKMLLSLVSLYFEELLPLCDITFWEQVATICQNAKNIEVEEQIAITFPRLREFIKLPRNPTLTAFKKAYEEGDMKTVLMIATKNQDSLFMKQIHYLAMSLDAALALKRREKARNIYKNLSEISPQFAIQFNNQMEEQGLLTSSSHLYASSSFFTDQISHSRRPINRDTRRITGYRND